MPGEWWVPRRAAEIADTPWLHEDVTEYFESLLRPSMRVLEHGAGGSTLWLAERVKEVITIESQDDWAEIVRQRAPENVALIMWRENELMPKMARKFDLVYIDGRLHNQRAEMVLEAPDLLRPGGYIVLDNANRPEHARARMELMGKAALIKAFDRNIPHSQYFVTEFYQMPKGKPRASRKKSKQAQEVTAAAT